MVFAKIDSFFKKLKMTEVKPGHFAIKEYHFHVYWFVNNEEQGEQKLNFMFLVFSFCVCASNFLTGAGCLLTKTKKK